MPEREETHPEFSVRRRCERGTLMTGGRNTYPPVMLLLAWDAYMEFAVTIRRAEEGGFWAEAPALPGCYSQGETVEETLENIREAIERHVEAIEACTLAQRPGGET